MAGMLDEAFGLGPMARRDMRRALDIAQPVYTSSLWLHNHKKPKKADISGSNYSFLIAYQFN